MERSIVAMGQINLWNLFFKNTWKGALKLIFVATADSLPQNFMKPVRVMVAPIDNWQTMMPIFEVVCRIFKKQGRERICRFDVRNDARNGKREV